jgi:hypothetical protein
MAVRRLGTRRRHGHADHDREDEHPQAWLAERFGPHLHELSIDMFPEDGRLHVCGVGEDSITAFTTDGIENLKQIIADMRADGRAPPRTASPE